MAGVPVLIPDGEPAVFEQAGAVDLGREIRGAWIEQQPEEHQRGGESPRGKRTAENDRRPGSYRPGPRPTRHRCGGYASVRTLERP